MAATSTKKKKAKTTDKGPSKGFDKFRQLPPVRQPRSVKAGKGKPSTVHIRGRAEKDTFCGGSHSPIWYNKTLATVEPRRADKATCGRCKRVARSKGLI